MKALYLLGISLFSSIALAQADLKSQLTHSQLADRAISNAQCGYWTERLVQVCDERQVPTQTPYTSCSYQKGNTYGSQYFPASLTLEHSGHVSCSQVERRSAFLGAGSPEFWAQYLLSNQSHLYKTGSTVEYYNCRDEYRYVWVEGGQCNAH